MRLEHHLVGGYVRYISPYIIIIIICVIKLRGGGGGCCEFIGIQQWKCKQK